MSSFLAGTKSKTIHLLLKRDRGCLTVYISSFLFYRGGGGNGTSINWLGSMRRGRGKKGGERESKALKSLHGKLKTMERGKVRGVMEAEVKIVESLKDK